MVSVGDRIRLTLNKGGDREGVVTGITGSMLRVRWASDEETTVIPGPGTLTVLGRTARKASRPRKQTTAAAKKGATKKTPSKRRAANAATGTRKVTPKKTPSKGAAARKEPGTAKKAPTNAASPRKAKSGQRSHSPRRSSR